jgi:hypothetical protein
MVFLHQNLRGIFFWFLGQPGDLEQLVGGCLLLVHHQLGSLLLLFYSAYVHINYLLVRTLLIAKISEQQQRFESAVLLKMEGEQLMGDWIRGVRTGWFG